MEIAANQCDRPVRLTRPQFRDASMGSFENLSGAWLIHCHLAPHQVMGMQALFMYGVSCSYLSPSD